MACLADRHPDSGAAGCGGNIPVCRFQPAMVGRSFCFAWHYLEPVPADRLDRLFHHVSPERFGRSGSLSGKSAGPPPSGMPSPSCGLPRPVIMPSSCSRGCFSAIRYWPSLSSCRAGRTCSCPLSRHCSGQSASMTRNVSGSPAGTMNSDPAGKKQQVPCTFGQTGQAHDTTGVRSRSTRASHANCRIRPEVDEKT